MTGSCFTVECLRSRQVDQGAPCGASSPCGRIERSILTRPTTSEADGTGFPRLGFAHHEPPPLVFVVIESLDRSFSLGVGVHLDKTEPFTAADITVLDDLGALHGAEWCEPFLQIR